MPDWFYNYPGKSILLRLRHIRMIDGMPLVIGDQSHWDQVSSVVGTCDAFPNFEPTFGIYEFQAARCVADKCFARVNGQMTEWPGGIKFHTGPHTGPTGNIYIYI